MATARQTTDHDEIREWVERNGGRPAQVEGTSGMLCIDFGEPDEPLEPIEWDNFFDVFDRGGFGFRYDPEGRMNEFVQLARDRVARGKGRKTSSTRKTRSTAKKTSTRKKTSARKTAGRKKTSTAKKSAPRKTSASRKKTAAKKTSSRKGTSARKKSSTRKYGPAASRDIERTMREMKEGTLRSGRSGKKVKNRKQAIAIGLSEARRSGGRVPPPSSGRRKSSARKKR